MDFQDHIELRALVDAYAVALDTRDADALTGLWVSDGVLVVQEEGPGAPASAELPFPRAAGGVIDRLSTYERTVHHVTTHAVFGEGKDAAGTTYCEAHHVFLGPNDHLLDKVLTIRYADSYRYEDRWRFTRREVGVLLREIRTVASLP